MHAHIQIVVREGNKGGHLPDQVCQHYHSRKVLPMVRKWQEDYICLYLSLVVVSTQSRNPNLRFGELVVFLFLMECFYKLYA